ncbi:PaaI family thioesterase [Acinetobacter sp. C_4_1]|uniref:PaaI family thioesterase n=1 Tax=unclassified Acinetobacter TaxID=196816 RepID=UPI0021B70866|nr:MULTISPECIES: PaaI family thioesterase [unclassified Acinetobacter]MCT8088869.1 PaaI family thioesterase [Acinetobacter sp. F_3_1]MCT8097025.1 PaaI family thioesterase [Acinetobacter sp. C_3_1]MCT8099982.1 PaaI family thioesterase [Acinetobacter sp. C_4_1]MCT8134380.1 PaaI family thioesterase [Acinetobacter sp. T_3_1]
MNPKEMTGLQLLQAMCDGRIPAPSMSETIPMQPYEVSEGMICFKVKANNHHLNPLGGVHGGFAATVLDSVTGCAVHSMLEAGAGYGTIDLNIKMCRPIPQDQQLLAIGKVINISKNLGISEGEIVDENGKLYAHATATCMIIR